jgi:hypothetical protein
MNLDKLMQIGVDAAAAFVVVNVVNAIRQGWLWPWLGKWLKAPRFKRDRQARVIGLAWWASVAVSAAFALRSSGGWWDWRTFLGEWGSRAIMSWLLSLGQFDIIKLAWPKMFDPGRPREEVTESHVDPDEDVAED